MAKIFAMIFTGIIVSFYYFPFEFSFLPGLNTKMGLAIVGIFLAVLNLIRKREVKFPHNLAHGFECNSRTFSGLSVSAYVSICACFSILQNVNQRAQQQG